MYASFPFPALIFRRNPWETMLSCRLTKDLLRFSHGSYFSLRSEKKSRMSKRTFIRVLQIARNYFLLNMDGLWVSKNVSTYQNFDSRFSRDLRGLYLPTMAVSLCKSRIPFIAKSVN